MSLRSVYLRASHYFRPDLGKISLATALVGLSTAASLAQPFPLAILIDSVLGGKHPDRWVHRLFFAVAPQSRIAQIILLAAVTLALRAIVQVINYFQGALKIEIGYNGLLRVRCDLYRKLQDLSLSYHRSRAQGDAIYRLSQDTLGFQASYNVLQDLIVNGFMLIFMVVIMFSMSWKLALVSMSIMPVLFVVIHRYGAMLTKSASRAAAVDADLTSTIQRSVSTISLVQAFGRERDEFRRFERDVQGSHAAWTKMYLQGLVYWGFLSLAFGVGGALIFGYGGYLAYQTQAIEAATHHPLEGGMTAGFLWVFIQLLTTQLYDPLYKLSASGTDLRRGMAGMVRVYEVLDTESMIRDAPDAIDLPVQPRVLALQHVSFGYRAETPVIRDISVSVRPGETIAFVGPSGVGKSSLLGLLPRFYDPTQGKLTLDEHDLRQVKLRSLRSHLALVLQDSMLLPASVADNIAYGRPEASREEIRDAARLAGADDFIRAMPQGYDTPIDEGGQNLSGGQRQRLNIARALATQAPVLILDEPTSALDGANERMITETLKGLKRLRTIIIVSHRLSTVADCDRIYVMDAGKIVEQGTQEQLVAQRGHYYELARHQMKLDQQTESPSADSAVTVTR